MFAIVVLLGGRGFSMNLGSTWGQATYRLGLRLDAAANAEAALEIGRCESLGGLPEHEFRLQGRMRW